MSYGADMLQVTEDTFKMIKSATSGIDAATGIAGIDFLPDLMSWVPVDTPFFNSVPRTQGRGSTAVFWETLLNVNSQQAWAGIQKEYAAPLALVQNQYTYSPYAVVGQGGTVTWDAIAQGEDYVDVLAVDTLQTINQQLIALEVNQLNSAAFALPTITTPTFVGTGTAGIASGTTIAVQARSNMNWYVGGSGVASSNATTAAAYASIVASVTPVKGAAGYDWYVGGFYYTTTFTPTVTITSKPTAAQLVPTNLAGLYGAGLAGPAQATADTSYQTYWQNGLKASILGDWNSSQPGGPVPTNVPSTPGLVTPGSGASQGAYYANNAGSALTVQGAGFAEIDTMNKAIYDKYQVTPSRMLMGSQTITDFVNAFLDNPQAVLFYGPRDSDGRPDMAMGGHVGTYLNKTVNGKPIPLWLMPYLPPGQIIEVIDSLPFPGSNVTSALQVRTLYDFFRFDYGANRTLNSATGGPRYDFEIRSEQAFINKAAGICGVLEGIGAGA